MCDQEYNVPQFITKYSEDSEKFGKALTARINIKRVSSGSEIALQIVCLSLMLTLWLNLRISPPATQERFFL